MLSVRLDTYFVEAQKHIDLIDESLEVLHKELPLREYDTLGQLERFALNALVFRFSKLQDLIGAKIFRAYLDYNEFNLSDQSFFDLLKEIEKEGIVDIDTWSELRELRNKVAHEYPEEADAIIESLNLFIEKSHELIAIAQRLKEKYHETKRERSQDH